PGDASRGRAAGRRSRRGSRAPLAHVAPRSRVCPACVRHAADRSEVSGEVLAIAMGPGSLKKGAISETGRCVAAWGRRFGSEPPADGRLASGQRVTWAAERGMDGGAEAAAPAGLRPRKPRAIVGRIEPMNGGTA